MGDEPVKSRPAQQTVGRTLILKAETRDNPYFRIQIVCIKFFSLEHYKQLVNVQALGVGTVEDEHHPQVVSRAGKYESLLFVIFLFYGTGVNSYNTTDLSLVFMSVLGLFYLVVVKKEAIDPIFWKVMAYWLVVNFFAWAFLGIENYKTATLIGSIFKLTIGYVFIKIFQERFILWFEKAVFILGLISLPWYMVQLYNPSILQSLPFNFVAPERLWANDWNGIIFNYQPVHVNQNSGFAGEPGTFGYYIGFAMICNLFLNRGKITRRFLVFLVVGLTTLSTNFYLTVMLFGCLYLLNSQGLLKYFAIILAFPLVYVIFQLPFLGEKIDEMIGITETFTEKSMIKWTRVNRFSYFLSQLGAIINYPFGYGINENAFLVKNLYGQVIEGTNGISRIGVRFGVFGFFYFFVVFFRFFKRFTIGFKGAFVLFLIVTMYLGANPMERDYFITAFFWMYFFVSEDQLKALQESYARQKQQGESQHETPALQPG